MQAIAAEAVLAPPDPDGPGTFRCAAPGYVSALYQAAGLREVAEWDVGGELVTDSPGQYWEMISEHVSLAVAALTQVSEPGRKRIAKAVTTRAGSYQEDGKVRIPRRPLHRRHQVGRPNWSVCAQLPSREADHDRIVVHSKPVRSPHPVKPVPLKRRGKEHRKMEMASVRGARGERTGSATSRASAAVVTATAFRALRTG
jgi:hypothetical protein